MKSYTEQDFIDLLAKQPEINFLAAAITPWHAMGIDATILKMSEQGIVLKGYIIVVAHALTGATIDECNFHMASLTDLEVVQITGDTAVRTIKQKIKLKYCLYRYYMQRKREIQRIDKLYWAVPLQPSYDLIPRVARVIKNKEIQIILTDEGIGSYTLTVLRWWKFNFMEGGLRFTRNILVRNVFFKHRLEKREQIQYHRLLKGKRGYLVPDDEAVAYYRKILAMENYKEDFSYYGKSVIINPNMLYESGILKDDSEMKIYTEICDAMVKDKTSVIIKPHPREQNVQKYEALNCCLETKCRVGQETILASLKEKPYCVVGFSSTTLITAKVLFGIQAISANYLIDKDKQRNKKYFTSFNKSFSNLLYMPKNMEELLSNIEEIKMIYEKSEVKKK